MKALTVMAMALSLLASACSTVGDPSRTYQNGWRQAQIVDVGNGQTVLPFVSQDCRARIEGGAEAARYAVTSYSYGGNPNLRRKLAVALPYGTDLAVGDWVYVNVVDCRLEPQRIRGADTHL